MKAIKKILVLMMAALLTFGVFSFAGCDEEGGFKIDKTKTQIYVHSYSGGFGIEWMEALIDRFEEDYKDYPGEDGKVGVQIVPDYQKTMGAGLLAAMSGNENYVLFTEGVNYYDWVAQGACLDLTDMLNEELTEYGETKSIMDKLTPTMQEALKVDTAEGEDRVYMVPHYAAYQGITLDIDLMDDKQLFLGKDGKFKYKSTDACTAGDLTGESGKLSAGQDGKFGTYDDGLPATYEEFFELIQLLNGVSYPFAWSGSYQRYVTQMMGCMAASAMGPEYAETLYTYNKTGFPVVKTNTIQADSKNPWSLTYETETVDITEANGYEVFRHPGFLTALAFVEAIVDNDYFKNSSFTGGVLHTDIQDEFLQSRLDTESFDKPIAMLIEGCWWENEASQSFKDLDDAYGDCGRMDRRLRFLPFPQIDEEHVGQGQVLLETNNAYGFINARTPEQYRQLSLEFLQYCNTDASLREYSRVTNTTKALKYELTAEDRAEMSYFGNSLMDIQEAEDTVIVYPMANNAKFKEKKSLLDVQDLWTMSATVKTPTVYFKDKKTTSDDAKAYFTSFCSNWRQGW